MSDLRMIRFTELGYELGTFHQQTSTTESFVLWESGDRSNELVSLDQLLSPFALNIRNVYFSNVKGQWKYPAVEAFVLNESESAKSRIKDFWDLEIQWDVEELLIALVQDFGLTGLPVNEFEDFLTNSLKVGDSDLAIILYCIADYFQLIAVERYFGIELRFVGPRLFAESKMRNLDTWSSTEVIKVGDDLKPVREILSIPESERISYFLGS